MRREQPEFSGTESKRRKWHLGAVGTAGARPACRSRSCSIKSHSKPNASEVVLEGADCGILKYPEESAGRIEVRAQYSSGESARRCAAGLQNEWRRPASGARVSRARNRARLVCHGVGQMAPAHHRHRPSVYRILSNARLRVSARRQRGGVAN